ISRRVGGIAPPEHSEWRFSDVEKTSTNLLEAVCAGLPFYLLKRKRLTIRSAIDAERELSAARVNLKRRASEVLSKWALPILLEAIGRAYYGTNRNEQWIVKGPALKLATAAIWPCVFHNSAGKRSLSNLIDIVGHAFLVDQLEALHGAIIASGIERFFVLIDSNGLQTEGPIWESLESIAIAFSARG